MIDEIIIRPMLLDDVPAVYAIDRVAHVVGWSEGIFRDCINAGYEAWVLERNNQLEGYVLFYIKVGECHILNLCVHPQCQRQGHGARILRRILEFSKSQDAHVALLETRVTNIPAINLYIKYGFKEVTIRKDYYDTPDGGREDAVMMSLPLKN